MQHKGDVLIPRSGRPGFNRRTKGPAVLLGLCCEVDQKMKDGTLRKREGWVELAGFRRAAQTGSPASPVIPDPGNGLAGPSNRLPVYGALVSHSC